MTAKPELQIAPFNHALGAEVLNVDLRRVSRSDAAQIRQAWLDHMVLLVRDQHLGDKDLVDFARVFGDVVLPISASRMAEGVSTKQSEYPEIEVISNVVENNIKIGNLGHGELAWHSDLSYQVEPYSATVLYGIEMPPSGGDTGFSNMYLALETLPEALRAAIRGRTIKHDDSHNSAGELRRGSRPITDVRTSSGNSHPIARTHPETGHNALFLGRRPYAYVNGLDVGESEELLNELWRHAGRPELTWHHQWRPGDVLAWDNRCTLHRRDAFDPAKRRIMHNTHCKGSCPVEDPTAWSRAPHPRSRAAHDAARSA